jgi:dipeptidyl aminopeptidase/acylaminoacyl peptidase
VIGAVLVMAAVTHSFDVRVAGPAGALGGTLTVPTNAPAPHPALVTLTGSGAHLRDGNRTPDHPYRPFMQIAGRLAACGVATLRLDDRGAGASAGDARAATLQDTAADARAALAFLRGRAGIDGRRLALLGHSYGGVVAPLVAADEPALAALVLMGAPARSFRETMRYQESYRIAHDPSVPASRRKAVLAEAMRRQAANVAGSREAWRRSIQDRDPLTTARRLRMPVLILHGTTDRAVDPADAVLLERALRESGNGHVTRRLFTDVNHHFQADTVGAREGYDRLPTQDLAPAVLDALCGWLGDALGARR